MQPNHWNRHCTDEEKSSHTCGSSWFSLKLGKKQNKKKSIKIITAENCQGIQGNGLFI